tara:strand:- start:25 stop:849 length:825 start_codon:yes stop_codon:yes gene_type:complete
MVISDNRRFVFIHIPKNAGTTITKILMENFESWDVNKIGGSEPGEEQTVSQHASLKWLGFNFPEKLLHKKICFSRNPFSRMVSWWTYYRTDPEYHGGYDLARHAWDMEFNEWLIKCIQRGRQEFVPQVYYISPYFKYELPPLSQEVLEARIGDSMKPGDPPRQESTIDIHPLRHNNFIREKFNLGETNNPTPIYQPIADFVGKIENFKEDIIRMFDYLGFKNEEVYIPHVNKSKEKVDYREQYNSESVEIVQSTFQQDFEYFNYSYDLADSSSG